MTGAMLATLKTTAGSAFASSAFPGFGLLAAELSWWDRLWWRDQVGTGVFNAGVDGVFFYIFWVSAASFAILMGMMVVFAIRYRRMPGVAPQPSPSHNTVLELTWSVVPLILMVVMFLWGFRVFLGMRIPPVDSEIVNVTAKQWSWKWEYDNGATSRELEKIADVESPVLALPLGRPVKFIMTSEDVIHSMYLPAFRAKRDVMPNMYTTMWVEATSGATHRFDEQQRKAVPISPANKGYYLTCTEYCGDKHSQMWGRIAVMEPADYQKWKEEQANTDAIDLLTLGRILHATKGCVACHSVDGTKSTGPTWKGIWGETHEFSNGPAPAKVDENYVRESILEPAKKVRAGFPNQMQSYQGQIKDREIRAIITFMRSLSNDAAEIDAARREAEREQQEKAAAPAAAPAP